MTPIPQPPRSAKDRVFVLLQGPHGPFFGQLGEMLEKTGARVFRVGFNAGDARFWPHKGSYIPYAKGPEDWAKDVAPLLEHLEATDLVLYGDVRPVHATALAAAERLGLKSHVFEEGYLRPSWVSYERQGANGNSALVEMSIRDIRAALDAYRPELAQAPAKWGEMRQHIWHGARYQFHVMFRNAAYPGFTPHRALPVRDEFALYLKSLAALPATMLRRALATRRIRRGGFPYHLFLMQLEHDSSFQAHSDYASHAEVLSETISAFARSAPSHHHLVIKAHPLEADHAKLSALVNRLGAQHSVSERLHYVLGGKLAPLLDAARSSVTVNSTAAQQALWRGMPVKVLGRAVYAKPELVSEQPLSAFFESPKPPDMAAYRDFRHFLLETSQVAGGFYSTKGRQQVLRQVVDLMLQDTDPYMALAKGYPRRKHPLHVVGSRDRPL